MSREAYFAELRERRERLALALRDVDPERWPAEERTQLRREIADLYRETERALAELGAIGAEARELIEHYKVVAAVAAPLAAPAPTPTGLEPARPARADHLNSSTHMERGWSAIAAGEYEKAIDELTRALELSPDDPRALGLLGWAQMLREEYDEALFSFHKVLARHPDDALARVNVGYICLKKQIFGEAIEHLSRAIRLDTDRKATLYAHFYLGLVYLEREMYADARGFFARALEMGPNLIEAYWELGRAFYLEGDHAGAVDAWRKGWQTNRFNLWGERCGEAATRVEAGGEVSFR
jgi:tetratricopeptide (TPR) repeat protein